MWHASYGLFYLNLILDISFLGLNLGLLKNSNIGQEFESIKCSKINNNMNKRLLEN